jgi:hypothetical protein
MVPELLCELFLAAILLFMGIICIIGSLSYIVIFFDCVDDNNIIKLFIQHKFNINNKE